MLIQVIKRYHGMLEAEWDPNVLQWAQQRLAQGKKVERAKAYAWLCALNNMFVQSLEMSLDFFKVPPDAIVRPLKDGELRFRDPHSSRMCIANTEADTIVQELPCIDQLPLCVHFLDQESSGWAAGHFIMGELKHIMLFMNDEFHGDWNSVSLACKKTDTYFWGTIMQLSVVYSLNHAPWNTSQFWRVKQQMLQALLEEGADTTVFDDMLPEIASEMDVALPTTVAERRALLHRLCEMQTVEYKGPTVKMMRWFSFFEAARFHEKEMYTQKCLLEGYRRSNGCSPCDEPLLLADGANQHPKEVVRRLREALGENTLSIAARLLTRENIENQKVLLVVMNPTWTLHGRRGSEKRTPTEGMVWSAKISRHWQDELADCCKTMRDPAALRAMGIVATTGAVAVLPPEASGSDTDSLPALVAEQQRLAIKVVDLVMHLLEQRAWRLAHHQFSPPFSFARLLVEFNQEDAYAVIADLRFQWEVLQKAEHLALHAKAWQAIVREIYWHEFSAIRLTWMILEDAEWQLKPTVENWFRGLVEHISDSKIIEDTHHDLRSQADREHSNQVSTRAARFQKAIRSHPLLARVPDAVRISQVSMSGGYRESKQWHRSKFNPPGSNCHNRGHASWPRSPRGKVHALTANGRQWPHGNGCSTMSASMRTHAMWRSMNHGSPAFCQSMGWCETSPPTKYFSACPMPPTEASCGMWRPAATRLALALCSTCHRRVALLILSLW